MNAEQLLENLRGLQESKGYFFNKDKEMVMALMESLLANKDRYGTMVCPCRLPSGDRDQDKDIICPCVYREGDVRTYGSCYCGLYVSQGWNEERIPHKYVPERRPPAFST